MPFALFSWSIIPPCLCWHLWKFSASVSLQTGTIMGHPFRLSLVSIPWPAGIPLRSRWSSPFSTCSLLWMPACYASNSASVSASVSFRLAQQWGHPARLHSLASISSRHPSALTWDIPIGHCSLLWMPACYASVFACVSASAFGESLQAPLESRCKHS